MIAPALVSIAVTPANPSVALGFTQQFTATGTYSDNSQQNLTSTVTWSSSPSTVATINSSGLASTSAQGTTTIKATSGAISGSTTLTVTAPVLQSIAVTPANPSVALGLTQQFTATGTYSDNSQQNLTSTVTWSSSLSTIATINSSGLASTVAQGTTTITATSGTISGSTTLTVTAPVLQSIAVTPANPSVALGLTQQFTATGTYSDNSQQNLTSTVTWNSSQSTIATISISGLATTVAQGTTTIGATYGTISGSTTLTVTAPALVSIAVTPANPSVPNGLQQQFTATGTYTDHSTQNLTGSASWNSSATAVATISNSGLATTLSLGTSTITATSGSINGQSTLTVVSSTGGPFISSFNLSQAAVGGTVTISGFNFGSSQGFSVVTFNGVSAGLCSPTPSCWSTNSISIKVPTGATTGNVVVSVNGVSSNGVSLAIVPPPVVTGVTPNWIPAGGTMTINGSNFGGSGTVTLNGTAVPATSWSSTAIGLTVPSTLPIATITGVVNASGASSQPFTFQLQQPPIITVVCLGVGVVSFNNCVAQGAIGAPVFISGQNMGESQGDSTVIFGGIPSSQVTQLGTNTVKATIPSGVTPGTGVNVHVIVDGASDTNSPPATFTVAAPPSINTTNGLSPSACSSGANCEGVLQVVISGSNFGSTPGAVSFNGAVATVASGNWNPNNNGQITTTVPVGAGTGPVVVIANGVASNSVNFTVLPNITSPLNPNSGPVGTSVQISGTGFGSPQGTSTVTFNGISANPTNWSDTLIAVPVPAGVATGSATVTVTVGGSNTTASFTVTASPSITSLSSTSGATGSLVGINGSAFGSSQGSSIVRFNGIAAQVCTSNCQTACSSNGWSNSCIPAIVPYGATTGPVSVTVSGQTATGPQFTVTGIGTGQISGTVTCSSGTATIQALLQGTVQGSTTTACNGSYTIPSLPADSYDVQASAPGFGTATQNAVLVTTGGNTSGINFNLNTAATITGQITQASGGAAINGATVQFYVGSALVGSVNTGAGNTYSISSLNAGTYRVQASAPAFTPPVVAQSQSVTVSAGATVTQNFALQALGSNPITYSYDKLGRLVGVVDPSGDAATYNYDQVGNITSIVRSSTSQVALLSIAPPSANIGDTVTLTGTGFSSTASQNTVQFTGGSAVASTSTPTQVVATVPSGAASGPVLVNVNGTTSNSLPFTVLTGAGAPTISSVGPPLIGVSGTNFTVNGSNFDAAATSDQWRLNILPLAVTGGSDPTTSVNTTVPANATSGHISVTTPGGTAVSTQDFIVPLPGYAASQIASSTRIPFPGSGSVTNLASTAAAMFLFDATGGQKATMTPVSGGFAGCVVAVYTPNNTQPLSDFDCTGPTKSFNLPVTGTYTIGILDNGPSTGSFSFALSNTTDFASTITFGQTVNVPLTAPGQNGRLTFLANAGQHISINVISGLGNPCNLTLLGPANQSLTSVYPPFHFTPAGDCSGNNGTTFWDVGYLPPLTGVYTILIAPQNLATGSVQLQLLDATDNIPMANPIALSTSGTQVNGTTTVAGQNIQQVFSGTAGQTISILANAVNNFSSIVQLSIVGPDGNLWVYPASISTNFFLDPRQNNLVLPLTGNYTILIDPNGPSTGTANFTLYQVVDTTGSLSVGTPTTMQTQTPGQDIVMTFNATIGQNLALEIDDVTTPQQIGCRFSIEDPNNQILPSFQNFPYQNDNCVTAGTFVELPDPLPAAGAFTIILQPSVGTGAVGSFQITLTNPVDNTYTISPTPTGAQLTVSTTIPGQGDAITFTGTAGQKISLHFDSASYNLSPFANVLITGPAGAASQQLFLSSLRQGGFADPDNMSNLPLSAGTYTVLISPANVTSKSVGSTTFTLYEFQDVNLGSIAVDGSSHQLTTTVPGQNATFTFTATGQVTIHPSNFTYPNPTACITYIYQNGNLVTDGFCFNNLILSNANGAYTVLVDPGSTDTGGLLFSLTSP